MTKMKVSHVPKRTREKVRKLLIKAFGKNKVETKKEEKKRLNNLKTKI